MRKNSRIVSAATALAISLPCLSLGALGCYREHERREVVVEPHHEHHEHDEHVVVKHEVEVR
jgi:hypothetical protein